LLQEVGGNVNARNNPARGEALFAAVWYADSEWAILCDATRATLIPRSSVERIEACNKRDDSLVQSVRELFENSPMGLRRTLDVELYGTSISKAGAGEDV
jgi:hypothetical protein